MLAQRAAFLFALLAVAATVSCGLRDGTLFVYAPPNEELAVHVDGKRVKRVLPGFYAVLTLKQGAHDVKLSTASGTVSARVEIRRGGERLFVRAPGQCYVVFDMTALYAKEDEPAPAAVGSLPVALRVVDDSPAVAPANLAFGALPQRTKREGSFHVMLYAPCEVAARDDRAVFDALASSLQQEITRALRRR